MRAEICESNLIKACLDRTWRLAIWPYFLKIWVSSSYLLNVFLHKLEVVLV